MVAGLANYPIEIRNTTETKNSYLYHQLDQPYLMGLQQHREQQQAILPDGVAVKLVFEYFHTLQILSLCRSDPLRRAHTHLDIIAAAKAAVDQIRVGLIHPWSQPLQNKLEASRPFLLKSIVAVVDALLLGRKLPCQMRFFVIVAVVVIQIPVHDAVQLIFELCSVK